MCILYTLTILCMYLIKLPHDTLQISVYENNYIILYYYKKNPDDEQFEQILFSVL